LVEITLTVEDLADRGCVLV